jgi:hypothetical protein
MFFVQLVTGGGMAGESRANARAWVGDGGSMEQLLRFESGGGTVFVEVADDEPGIERATRVDDVVIKARESLESALEQVRVVANVTLAKLGNLARQPEQVEVQFGIRLTAEAGAVIARTEAEGHLQVKLTWSRSAAGDVVAGT